MFALLEAVNKNSLKKGVALYLLKNTRYLKPKKALCCGVKTTTEGTLKGFEKLLTTNYFFTPQTTSEKPEKDMA